MDKRFWAILIVIALALGGVFFVSNTHKAGAPGDTSGKQALTNHVEGNSSTGVKLVEYGDYQCPACGQYYEPVKQTVEKYKDQISFQFRNFPLYQIHNNAMAAARAAEAAALQDKFWEMHDKLYVNQQNWESSSSAQSVFAGYAKDLGLDVDKFNQDFKSSAVNSRIQADLKEGTRLGVESTPTFFLDGKKISNPDATVDGFSKVIEAEIAKQAKSSDSSQ